MIDCHSHTAIEGGVNEGTNSVTAECRIEDVLDADDVNIYRQLAGGTTTANLLHGSANAIGGQNAVVKWRWGGKPDDLLLAGAPQRHQVRARRKPQALQLAARVGGSAALPRDPHGRGKNDPRHVCSGTRVPGKVESIPGRQNQSRAAPRSAIRRRVEILETSGSSIATRIGRTRF
jgi:hypothetical protein